MTELTITEVYAIGLPIILVMILIETLISGFNKKSLYILIREMTNVDTIHITSVVNVFKKHYKKILENHFKTTSKIKIPKELNKFF